MIMVKVRKVLNAEIRTVAEIKDMLDQSIEQQKHWYDFFKSRQMGQKENAQALRNYTALRGVVKTLRWVLKEIEEEPLR
tara:strand:- start:19981 stop:20217 length:237 start_codon:yes stop_codon:yes gene_type:complete